MRSLSNINSQITTLQTFLYSINQQIEQKREELERLKRVLSRLVDYQDEFRINQKLCNNPELSTHTWNGQLATQFHSIRTNEIMTSYQSIKDLQLNQTITQINDKIQRIKEAVGDLQDDYTSQSSRLNNLVERRREELAEQ